MVDRTSIPTDSLGNPDPGYLSIQDAADYIGVSAQTLRRWDLSGELSPVRHPVSGYRFYKRADLESYRLEYRRAEARTEDMGEIFQIPANIDANERLRDPQREAHRAVRDHFATKSEPVMLQIPVGCGKTGLIAILPFGVAKGRVLVITPNLTIRKGVAEALDIASPKCFWLRTRVLSTIEQGPFCAILNGADANLHDCNESHFVVTNIQQLASSADRWLPQFPQNFFDMILVDEGHHNAAESWRKVFERFPNAKVASLTATPFRSDRQDLEGEVIYRYPFAKAMIKGYIKQIHSVNVAPDEIYFTYRGDSRHHTLAEVLSLREEQWFRRGVALAPECNRHIVEASIQHCLALRAKSGTHHQIIAVACSVDHARQVRALYEERNWKAREIHSEMDEVEQDAVIDDLKKGRIDCVVQVQMLGEGFDHPLLSVAAIFRPFRSLSPYIQFVGRIMRVIHENEPGHVDNQGYIISHVGLNNDEHWDDFRELDLADQKIFREWLNAQPPTAPEGDGDGEGRPRRFDLGMQVDNEIVSHFIGASFLNPEDERVLKEILSREVIAGVKVGDLMTKDSLQQKLRKMQESLDQQPKKIPVSPQRRRQAARKRLSERSNSVVNRIIADLGFKQGGWEVGKVITSVGAQDNRSAVTELLNKAINKSVGIASKQRKDMSADQAENALENLDNVGDQVRDEIRNHLP